MSFRNALRIVARSLPVFVFAGTLAAQTPAADPSARLREVLPADVAERVLQRIAEARARELPAQALENRALKFAARGIAPAEVERAVMEHATRMEKAKQALENGRADRPSATEIEAGAEAMRQGVDGAAVSALAKSAPSGRSLAVPLFVIGSLMERGLPSDEALARVQERLLARASDTELERMPAGAGAGRPAGVMPGAAPGRPSTAGVPANGGRTTAPQPTRRPTPPSAPAPGSKRP